MSDSEKNLVQEIIDDLEITIVKLKNLQNKLKSHKHRKTIKLALVNKFKHYYHHHKHHHKK